jgi:hypothetical protein
LKAESERKSFGVALHLLIESPDFYVIQFGEIGVEDNPLSSQNEDLRITLFATASAVFVIFESSSKLK